MSFLNSILAEAKGIPNTPSNVSRHTPKNMTAGASATPIATPHTKTTRKTDPAVARHKVATQPNAPTTIGKTATVSSTHRSDSQVKDSGHSARPTLKKRTSRSSRSAQRTRGNNKKAPPLAGQPPTRPHDSPRDEPLLQPRPSPSPSAIYKIPPSEHETATTGSGSSKSSYHSKSPDLFNLPPAMKEGLITAVRELEKRSARSQKGSYIPMKHQQLREEAQFRGLELVRNEKVYLEELLVVSDDAYFELMQKLGDRYLAEEFAQGAVRQYNRELERKEAVREQAIIETAVKVESVSAKRKRVSRRSNDTGYSTKSLDSPTQINKQSHEEERLEGKKRHRSSKDGENMMPKKAKLSLAEKCPHPHALVPQTIQDDSDSFHTDYTSDMDSEMSDDQQHVPATQLPRHTEHEPDPPANASAPDEDCEMSHIDKKSDQEAEVQKPVQKPPGKQKSVQKEVKRGTAIVKNGSRKPRSSASKAAARDRMNVKRYLKF